MDTETITGWVNIYETPRGDWYVSVLHKTKERSEQASKDMKPIARVKVIFKKGQGL